jgi:hypothetical protein
MTRASNNAFPKGNASARPGETQRPHLALRRRNHRTGKSTPTTEVDSRRSIQPPANQLDLVVLPFPTNPRNIFSGCDVVTGLEQWNFVVEVPPNADFAKFAWSNRTGHT